MQNFTAKYKAGLLTSVAASAAALSACGSGDEVKSAVFQTPQGPVQGIISENGITNIRAIPYAAPPVGELRRRPHAPVQNKCPHPRP